MTDWLLYDISKNVLSVRYLAFTRHQESRVTGADWEWWMLFPTCYLRFRVQAKKVFYRKNNYPELARASGSSLQIEKLLNDSQVANAIPLYVFYSAESGSLMCDNLSGKSDEGVFVASAVRIHDDFFKTGRRMARADDLLIRTNPLSCFVCCPLISVLDNGVPPYFDVYYPVDHSSLGDEGENIKLGIHSELPLYVSALLSSNREESSDWIEQEFSSELQDFNAIVVCDFRF